MPISSLDDFIIAIQRWRIWVFWAQHELHQRYRRSFLGPLWISLTTGFNILVLGIVWAYLFKAPYQEYLPYVSLGICVWQLVSAILMEGANCFINAKDMVIQSTQPLTIYFCQMIYRNLLNFFHNITIFIIVALIFRVVPSIQIVLMPIALIVVVLGVAWIGLLLGMISVRFRDIPVLVQNLLIVLMFITPVMFRIKDLGDGAFIAHWNPLYHLLQIFRAPLLGEGATLVNWVVAIIFTVVGWAFTLWIYGRYRRRISYWL
jgi:ABC-type polysaccharide/polyol phosphate export permease